jgi:pheromone a factor receptor
VGVSTALSACSLSINRRLASIASSRTVTVDQRKRKLSLFFDLALCVGVPILVMALSYIVQPHRFNVLEGFGCQTPVWPSIPALLIIYLWPCLLSVASVVYGGKFTRVHIMVVLTTGSVVATRFFLSRRLQLNTLLRSSNSGLDTGHYFRLMLMASADLILGFPLTILFLVTMARSLSPWTSFSDIHYGWSFVEQVSAAEFARFWETPSMFALYVATTWLCPMLSLIFFLFFGITPDAIGEYMRWIENIRGGFRRVAGRVIESVLSSP